MSAAILAVLLSLTARAQQAPPQGGPQVLDLNCVDALVAVGEIRLAGVFSFIPEKDLPAAFADLLVHDKRDLKKFLAKDDKDLKEAHGVSRWDQDALQTALSILSSPVGRTVEKPSDKTLQRMVALTRAPALTLDQISAARGKR